MTHSAYPCLENKRLRFHLYLRLSLCESEYQSHTTRICKYGTLSYIAHNLPLGIFLLKSHFHHIDSYLFLTIRKLTTDFCHRERKTYYNANDERRLPGNPGYMIFFIVRLQSGVVNHLKLLKHKQTYNRRNYRAKILSNSRSMFESFRNDRN